MTDEFWSISHVFVYLKHDGHVLTCVCGIISVCDRGQWACVEENCPGTCSVEGGAHVHTFDGRVFTFHGDCSYVLAKVIISSLFAITITYVPKLLYSSCSIVNHCNKCVSVCYDE